MTNHEQQTTYYKPQTTNRKPQTRKHKPTPQRDGLEECKQCGKKFKDFPSHLYSEHFDSLKAITQQRLSAKFGPKAPFQHHGTNNVLAVTSGAHGASGGASSSMHETAVAYEAAGLTSFPWEGKVVNINHDQ